MGLPSLFDLLQGQSIYICGMTKSLCPGLRIAYVAFADRFRAPLLHGLTNVNLKTSSFDAEVITELLLSGKAYQIAAQKRQWAQRNARLYSRYFPADPAPSYYKWLPVRLPQSPRQVEQELQALGVRVYHSARFAAAPSGGPEIFARLPCALPGAPAAWSRDSEFCNTISKNTPRHSGEKPITWAEVFLAAHLERKTGCRLWPASCFAAVSFMELSHTGGALCTSLPKRVRRAVIGLWTCAAWAAGLLPLAFEPLHQLRDQQQILI